MQRASGAPETRGKLYRGAGALRLEASDGGSDRARGVILIYDVARNVTYFLNPAMKAYVERAGSEAGGPLALFAAQRDNPCALAAQVAKDVTCQHLGTETVNGRSAEKWETTQTRGGRRITEYAWVDPEWHIAVQWVTEDHKNGHLANVRLGPQPAALFVLPSDYRKLETPSRRAPAP